MAYRCNSCGNTRDFHIVYDATITEYIKGGDKDDDNAGDVNGQELSHYICLSCDGNDVDEDADPIGELPRDHPARRDMGGTGHPNDYPMYNRFLLYKTQAAFEAAGGRGVDTADLIDALNRYVR